MLLRTVVAHSVFLYFSSILFAAPFGQDSKQTEAKSGTLSTTNQAANLKVILQTDKSIYSVGDEIHIQVEFINYGKAPFRIIIDDTFIGSNIDIKNMQGDDCPYSGGYNSWSPKMGVYTGRTYLLRPDEKLAIKMDALVSSNYELIFSNLLDRKGHSDYQELKKQNHLPASFPDKYISAGRIFSLSKPNKYALTFVYEAKENDKYWHFIGARTEEEASVEQLFIGAVKSDPIVIVIK